MKIRTTILLIALPALLAGCVRGIEPEENSMRVKLNAGIAMSPVATKAGGPYDADSPEQLDISMLRMENGVAGSPLSATLGSPDPANGYLRPISFDTHQFFPDRTTELGFIGWYPSAAAYSVKDGTHTLSYDDIPGDTDMMVSSYVSGSFESGIPPTVFSHALCQYTVSVYAVDEDARKQWEDEYGNIAGVSISNLYASLSAVLKTSADAVTSISYEGGPRGYEVYSGSFEIPVGESGKTGIGNVVMAAPALENALTVTVTFEKTDGTGAALTKKIVMSRNFKAGYRYGLTLRFSHNGLIEPVSAVEDWENVDAGVGLGDGKTYYNLSSNGTANCYIVSSANVSYCFDCTVKGNGVNTVTDYRGNVYRLPDTEVSLQPDRLEILRSYAVLKKRDGSQFTAVPEEDRSDPELMLSLDYDTPHEGKAMFTLKGNPSNPEDYSLQYKGNVLIGAFSGETLLWSWHIWITDRPDTQGYGNGYSSLDRNLGAVDDDPENAADFAENDELGKVLTTGFYYQWGRKDPLSRYDVDPLMNHPGYRDYQHQGLASMAEAHRNPRVMFYDAGSNDWTSDADDHLWGYANQRDNVVKTLYDPCPPGYRVPDTKVWTESAQYELEQHETYGYVFDIDGNQKIFYPRTNYLGYDGEDISLMTYEKPGGMPYIYLNSARPHICSDFTGEAGTTPEHESLAHHFVFSLDMQDSGDYIPYEKDKAGARANAMPVRCISENAAPATTDLSEVQTANCYMVSKNGYFKFRADRRGNGVGSFNSYISKNNVLYNVLVDISGGLNPEIETDSDYHVDVLWWQGELDGTWDGLVRNFGNSSEKIASRVPLVMVDGGRLDDDGYAYFYVREGLDTYGNVGLALYDGNGRIVWTWHIWFIANERNALLGDYLVMSRNLGATYTPYDVAGNFNMGDRIEETYGFYYQWGRKDPLFGPGKWFRKNADGSWEVKDWSQRPESASATTLSASTENPLVFRTSSTENQWQTTFTPGTADIQEVRNFWGYVGRQDGGQNFIKTMYDPCPPGYRVINNLSFESAGLCHQTGEDWYRLTFNSDSREEGGIRVDDTNSMSSSFSPGNAVANVLWLPSAGWINQSGSYDGIGGHGYLNSATPNAMGEKMREFEWEWYTQWWPNSSYYRIPQFSQHNHLGARPVRCQKE